MNEQTQKYTLLVHSFYTKLIKSHPRRAEHLFNFQVLLKSFKNQSLQKSASNKLLRTKSELTIQTLNNYSNTLLSNKKMGLNSKKQKNNYLFTHKNFSVVFSFAYIHFLIKQQKYEQMKRIQIKVKLYLDNDYSKERKANLNQSLVEWQKITNLLQCKNIVRWQKILALAFSLLNQYFIQIIMKSILSLNTSNNIQLRPYPQLLQKICSHLRISIAFFTIVENQIKNSSTYGVGFNNQIILAFQKQKILYLCLENLPSQDDFYQKSTTNTSINSKQIHLNLSDRLGTQYKKLKQKWQHHKKQYENQQDLNVDEQKKIIQKKKSINYTLLRRKTLTTVQYLLTQYENGTTKLMNLDCFKTNQNAKINQKQLKKVRSAQNFRIPLN